MNKWGLDFPGYFPEDCPPGDAKNDEVTVFRLCRNHDVVTSEDFITYYEINPEKWKNEILAYGLSVLSNQEESEKMLKLPANRKRFKSIAVGTIYPIMGVVKNTPTKSNRYHCTWWICENVKPEINFDIIK